MPSCSGLYVHQLITPHYCKEEIVLLCFDLEAPPPPQSGFCPTNMSQLPLHSAHLALPTQDPRCGGADSRLETLGV
jgi:hypothetical protein